MKLGYRQQTMQAPIGWTLNCSPGDQVLSTSKTCLLYFLITFGYLFIMASIALSFNPFILATFLYSIFITMKGSGGEIFSQAKIELL